MNFVGGQKRVHIARPPVNEVALSLLTRIDLLFDHDHFNYWLRFGAPDEWRALDRRRVVTGFKPGKVFAYVRWASGAYGTTSWTLTIGRSEQPGCPLLCVPGIHPGVDCLGFLFGKAHVKRGLKLIDDVERQGFAPEEISPHWWRMAVNRMKLNLTVRHYTPDQHHAFLKANRLNL